MTPPTIPSNAVLLERVEALRCDVAELNKTLAQFISETHQFRITYTEGHANVVQRVNVLESHQKETDKKLDEITADIAKLLPVYKGVLWLAGVIGVAVVALVWSIITHQVNITF